MMSEMDVPDLGIMVALTKFKKKCNGFESIASMGCAPDLRK